MALSEKKHHTSRGQRKDRARGWVRDALHGQVPGAPTPQLEFFQLFEEEPGGSRPPCLGEPRGATGGGFAADAPVPEMGNQLEACFWTLRSPSR